MISKITKSFPRITKPLVRCYSKHRNAVALAPFGFTDPFFRDIASPLDSFFRPFSDLVEAGEQMARIVRINIKETDKNYIISADCPGMKKEDLKVSLDRGVLTISGERKEEKEEKDDKSHKYHRVEKHYGRFERSIPLPEDANEKNIKADYKDGVLKLSIEKNPGKESSSHAIEIGAGEESEKHESK